MEKNWSRSLDLNSEARLQDLKVLGTHLASKIELLDFGGQLHITHHLKNYRIQKHVIKNIEVNIHRRGENPILDMQ